MGDDVRGLTGGGTGKARRVEPVPGAQRGGAAARPSLLRRGLAAAGGATAVGVMLRLALWQWDRGQARGALLNYSYAVEWALLAGLTVAGLLRLRSEGAQAGGRPRHDGEAVPGAPMVGPALAPGEELQEVTWLRIRRRLGLDAGPSGG